MTFLSLTEGLPDPVVRSVAMTTRTATSPFRWQLSKCAPLQPDRSLLFHSVLGTSAASVLSVPLA
jgi:hypothetical protein